MDIVCDPFKCMNLKITIVNIRPSKSRVVQGPAIFNTHVLALCDRTLELPMLGLVNVIVNQLHSIPFNKLQLTDFANSRIRRLLEDGID